jgi:hypothetical protein
MAECETEGEVLNFISVHAVNVHNMIKEDTYKENMPTAFLCQSIGKMMSTDCKRRCIIQVI